ncbi:hypothetical protein EC988_000783 [Linderina pennispora]|nr:hypothetical protein EC988_000783 [Linderina pennispora]
MSQGDTFVADACRHSSSLFTTVEANSRRNTIHKAASAETAPGIHETADSSLYSPPHSRRERDRAASRAYKTVSARDLRRQTLQGHYQASLDQPSRSSLDGHRSAINKQMNRKSTMRDHRLEPSRPRRYTMEPHHTRNMSCPTLDITRIMRSIGGSPASLSSAPMGESEAAWPARRARSARTPTKPNSAPESTQRYSLASLRSVTPSADVSSSAASVQSQLDLLTALLEDTPGAVPCSNAETSNSLKFSQYEFATAAMPNRPRHRRGSLSANDGDFFNDTIGQSLLMTDGLRHRASLKHRDAATPDVHVTHGAVATPPSPPLSEITDAMFASPHGSPQQKVRRAASARSNASSCSSTTVKRWSTLSGESTEMAHKRYSYNQTALAEGLQDALDDTIHTDLTLLSTSADQPEETMTITLKGPGKRASGEFDGSEQSASLRPSVDDRPLRPSLDSIGDAAVPAVYLNGSASLWDQYVAELTSAEFDQNIHLKRQRVFQLLRVPWEAEKLLWFGIAICFDALLYVFAILPVRFLRATCSLIAAVFTELPAILETLASSEPAKRAAAVLPETWKTRLVGAGSSLVGVVARISGRPRSSSATRWLSPIQLFDFYRGLLLIVTCAMLCRIDAAQMYHSIRAQSSLKLYFIFSALDIFDRLLSSYGHDVLDALQSTVTDPRSQRWRSGLGYYALAQGYMFVHTLVLFYQVITLNVAVNAYSDQLLSLLISNQFVEIKSNVFKKWEKEMLFQVSCADIVERFQQIVFLLIIILRNLAELSGTGFSALFTSDTQQQPPVQPPVAFDAATPSAFGPLLPAWMSAPIINRVATPVLMVLGSEILIDWIKHTFITKLNWIRPEIYSHYIDVLSRDLACSKSQQSSSTASVPGEAQPAVAAVAAAETASPRRSGESGRNSSAGDGASRPVPPASSVLTHAVGKLSAWVKVHLVPDSDITVIESDSEVDDEGTARASTELGRARGHRRTRSVTRPQLFVEQSSKVARRLGLSPMPLACMVTLMLLQVLHILAASSRSNLLALQQTVADEALKTAPGSSWVFAIPLVGLVLRALSMVVRTAASMLTAEGLSYFGYVLLHPHAMVAWVLWPFTSPRGGPVAGAFFGWAILDIVGWAAMVLIVYALVVWIKLMTGTRLVQFAWVRHRDFERRTKENKGTKADTKNLKQFDDSTKKLDNDAFFEVGKLIGKEKTEAEWEKQRPKWTMDNIERYSLFKSRVP